MSAPVAKRPALVGSSWRAKALCFIVCSIPMLTAAAELDPVSSCGQPDVASDLATGGGSSLLQRQGLRESAASSSSTEDANSHHKHNHHARRSSEQHSFESTSGVRIQGNPAGQETSLGATASLDEAGYYDVLRMNNEREMEVFARRTVDDLGLVIVDDKRLIDLLKSRNDKAAGFGHFKGKVLNLLGTPNAPVTDPEHAEPPLSGEDAALSEEGYKELVKLNSNPETVSFIQRVVDDMGLEVTNFGGVQGLAPYYSGDKRVQNFANLEMEIRHTSQVPGSWVKRL